MQLALYGLGIYGLIGQAAGRVGNAVGLAFVVALVSSLLTALSYASLGSRYLRAAGAAYVAERAYGLPLLSLTVGLALVYSGLTSVATQSHVFATNLAVLLHIERIGHQSRGAPAHRTYSSLVARARLSARAARCRVPRHSQIHVAECAVPLVEASGWRRRSPCSAPLPNLPRRLRFRC